MVRRKGIKPQLQPVIKIQDENPHGWQSNGITRGFKDQTRGDSALGIVHGSSDTVADQQALVDETGEGGFDGVAVGTSGG